MNKINKIFSRISFSGLFVFVSIICNAQMLITPNQSASILVDRLVGPGVVYTNPTLTCPTNASGKFNNGILTTVTMDSGIVLTTGSAVVVNQSAAISASYSNGTTGGYATLQAAATGTINDLCKLEFDFVPIGDTIKFYYRFGSDEYPSYTCSNFNDIFSFFITGPGYGAPTNLALIPGTNCPVSINTVNGSTSNPCGSVTAPCAPPNNALFINSSTSTSVVYSGITTKLQSIASVVPCSTYHMVFAIADVYDGILDSGVFLEANSFTSSAATVSSVSSSNNLSSPNPFGIEGCNAASITISRPSPKPYPQTINLVYTGTATIGTDCNVLPTSVTIPANGVSTSVNILPTLDAISEGVETIKIYVYGTLCVNTITDSITVDILDFPTYSVTDNDTICLGQSKTLTAIPSPVNGNLSFNWSPAATLNQTTGNTVIATPIVNTTYTVSATYPGCPVKDSTISITVEPTPTVNLTAIDVLCNATNTGSITANGNAVMMPISFTLNPSNVLQNNSPTTFSNLLAGMYTVTITSSAGCTSNSSINILQPSPIVVNVNATSVPCVGGSGTINVNASGGTLGYQYNLNGGTYQMSSIFSNLNSGTYTISVKDANNCTATTLAIINQSASMTLSVMSSPINCNGGTSTLLATVSGGNPTYQYNINGGANQGSNIFSNLLAGIYTITAIDASSCSVTTSITIAQPQPLNVIVATNPILCNGDTTSIIVSASGGTPNYSFKLNNGTYQTTSLFTSIVPNTYTITAKDNNSCLVTTVVTITQPAPMSWLSFTQNTIPCNTSNNGQISASAGGGVPNYTYTLMPNAISNNNGLFTSLAGGTYTVNVSDANNCTLSNSTIIIQSLPPVFNTPSITQVLCNGGTNGSITTTVSGGTGTISYQLQPTNQTNTTGIFATLGANTYTITATDINNCSTTTQVTIIEPSPLQVTNISTTAPTCVPGNDGSMTVTASGGTTTYQYNINGGTNQGSNVFSNLNSGTYTIQVTDANNCTATSTQAITAPNSPSITVSSTTAVLCNGGNNGSITATTTGGTGSITYQLQPTNQTNSTGIFTSLTANTYTITATDVIGCSVTTQVVIAAPSILTWTSNTATNILCNGGNNGSISTAATGGTGTITYQLQPSNQSNTTGSFTTLNANTYTITATDINNCSITTQLTISEPPTIVWNTPSITQVLCNGGTNGSITTTVSGGTGTISYQLQPTNQTNTTGIFATLGANTYTITATDINNCSTTTQVTIIEPSPLQVTNISTTAPTCVPGNDGSMTVTASGGTTTYQYNINGGTNQGSNVFSNLNSGTYTIQVTDANNCTATSTQTITAPNSPSITVSSTTAVLCNGGNNGSITATTTGGTGSITYQLQPTNQTNSTGIFTSLTANTYTITATDVIGCSVTTQVVIAAPSILTWTSNTATNILCNGGNNGSISTAATGGTGTITYQLQPSNQSNTTGSFTTLNANTYTITATDINNCSITTQLTISEPPTIVWNTPSITQVLCNGGTNGSITTTVSGGTGTISYQLQPTNQTNTTGIFATLGANTYTITATDINNCSTTTQVTIIEPSPLQVTNISTTAPTCVPGNDGSMTVTASGGTTTYQYNINGGTNQGSNVFSNLNSGTYTIQVTDANNCTATSTQTITAPNSPSITVSSTTAVLCNGGNNGSITATTTGGTGSITYQLQPTNQTNSTGIFTSLTANTYTITATDVIGCSVTTQVVIAAPSILTWTSNTATNILCNGGNNGSISTAATGGTGTITYQLQPSNQSNTTGSFTTLNANTYTITATDINNCSITTQLTISEPPTIVWNTPSITQVLCNGGTNGSITTTVSGGTGTISYQLQPTNQTNTTGIFATLGANTYTITATDINNCSTTTQVTIIEPSPLQVTNISTTAPTCVPGNDGSMTVTASGGTTTYQYNINGGTNQGSNVFSNLNSGTYTIQVTDANNCTATSTQTITAPNSPSITVSSTTAVLCNGGNNGSITATTTGGTGSITYQLQPTNQTNSTGIFTSLTANTYTITATDVIGCSVTTQVVIAAPSILTWTSNTATNILCNGGNNGSISTAATGGTGTITYQLQPSNQSNTTGSFTTLNANTYTITATDINNCSITTQLTISEPPTIVWNTPSITQVLCNGGTNGSITTTVSGGTGTINYQLQPTNQTNTTGIFTTLGANTYTITATDINNCSTTTQVTIIEPSPLQVTNISTTAPTCVPGNDGSMTVTASGGTTTYQYNINGGTNQGSNVFSNLNSGTYTIQVTDANNCTATSIQTITAPNSPSITNVSTTNATCVPGSDGTITLTGNGGVPLYSYSSNGVTFQASNVLTGLAAGSYTVTIKDAIGCIGTSTVSISTPPSPNISLTSSSDASCMPGCDGSAIFSASGGTSPIYTFSIDAVNFQSSNIFNLLCIGNYTVTVKDGNGCTATNTFAINTVNGPVLSLSTSNDVSCFNGNNGAVNVTIVGGTGIINYTILPNNYTNTIGVFNALNANTYTINAVDANGCTSSTLATINQPAELQFSSINSNGSLCNGASNGSIDVATTGGTPTINYSISPAALFTPPSTFSNLVGNTTYTIVATDANLCSISTVVFVAQPQSLNITSTNVTNVTCNGLLDGIANVTATGGTGLLSYSLLPNLQNNTTGLFNGLSANTYTVTVTDINNCTSTTSILINEPNAIIQDSLIVNNETCNNTTDGAISIICSGGTGALSYNLMPNNITNVTGNFASLSGNNYIITVSDVNLCTYTTTVPLLNPLPLSIDSSNVVNVLCNGDSNGFVQLFISGGTGAIYYFNLNPGNISNTNGSFSNLPIGVYTITAKDINDCSVSTTITISQPLPLIANFISKTDIICHNANNGTINVNATGGLIPYSFTLQPVAINNTTGVFNSLSAGVYTVVVSDANLCTAEITNISIVNPTQIIFAQVNTEKIKCFGDATGKINVLASGGIGTITYAILPVIGISTGIGQYENLTAGVYTVSATDANNCVVTTAIIIEQNPEIKIDKLNYTEPTCYGDNNGTIDIEAIGGTGTLTYQLNIDNPVIVGHYTNIKAGNYQLTIRDSLNCTLVSMFNMTQPEPINVKELEVNPVYCIGASNGKIIATGSGGRGAYTYYLTPGLYINKSGYFANLHEGIYTLTIKDSAGCHFDTMLVIGPPLHPFRITTSHKDLGCYGTGIEGWAEAHVQGGEPPYTYLWSSNPVQYTPRAENLEFGYYFVEVTDGSGCKAKDTVYIEPGPCCNEVFIPNAFTPNGDGNNDVFRVTTSAGIELIQFDVYDRWGKRVWSTNDFRSGWDGTYMGMDESLNTFYYVFRYKCLTDGENYIKKGDITVIR